MLSLLFAIVAPAPRLLGQARGGGNVRGEGRPNVRNTEMNPNASQVKGLLRQSVRSVCSEPLVGLLGVLASDESIQAFITTGVMSISVAKLISEGASEHCSTKRH